MEWLNILIARLRALFRRESVLQDIEEELRIHVEMAIEENIKRGVPSDKARAAALRSFGNPARNTELGYVIRGGGWLEALWQDLRFGARMLLRQPGFTLIAVLTLALGIGANMAIFSLINVVLLKPVSGREPERLEGVYSRGTTRADDYRLFSHPNYTDLRVRSEVFDDILATNLFSAGVTEGDTTRRIMAVKISANYFSVFGVQLAQGRPFTAQEETQPAPIAIVSHRWWRQHGALPDLVGQSIRVNGRPLTVVGITPKGFTGPVAFFSTDLFLPLSFDHLGAEAASNPMQDRKRHDLTLVGRLKQGLTLEEANARLNKPVRPIGFWDGVRAPGGRRADCLLAARSPGDQSRSDGGAQKWVASPNSHMRFIRAEKNDPQGPKVSMERLMERVLRGGSGGGPSSSSRSARRAKDIPIEAIHSGSPPEQSRFR